MIRESGNVFLGVVVQPKTKEPVFVQRTPFRDRTVDILAIDGKGYLVVGVGYLEERGATEYLRATEITGYPRAHTPNGVIRERHGQGYGTCLYTGLVMLAAAADRKQLEVLDMAGRGAGICSESESRSDDADRWWNAAYERDLTHQMEGDAPEETETEELEDEDVSDHVSSRGWRTIESVIHDQMIDHSEWSIAGGVRVTANLQREVPTDRSGDAITADYYRLTDALGHHLVAVEDVAVGNVMTWARRSSNPTESGGRIHKDVLLSLNVTHQDLTVTARLALLAKQAGATDSEVTEMMMRNKYGTDILRGAALPTLADLAAGATRRTSKRPPPTERGRTAPLPNPAPPPVIIPVPRRNPPPVPSERDRLDLERAAERLERRREKLGWDKLEDLP